MDSSLPADVLDAARTQSGESLGELSRKSPVLVVFLRHCGCTFAREALADVAAQRAAITACGTRIVVVHMQTEDDARSLFARYGLSDILRISDPEQKLYQAFELQRGSFWQVAGPGMWGRAVASIVKGNWFGVPSADVFQLPGAFLLRDGQIVNEFRGRVSSDRPNYQEVAKCDVG
jgi:hypothetical protein